MLLIHPATIQRFAPFRRHNRISEPNNIHTLYCILSPLSAVSSDYFQHLALLSAHNLHTYCYCCVCETAGRTVSDNAHYPLCSLFFLVNSMTLIWWVLRLSIRGGWGDEAPHQCLLEVGSKLALPINADVRCIDDTIHIPQACRTITT